MRSAPSPHTGAGHAGGIVGVGGEDVLQLPALLRFHLDQRASGHGVEMFLHERIGARSIAALQRVL